MARSIIIYVSGVDGSGKTTVASILEQQLRRHGLPVVRIWFRFPYLILYPLLFLAHKVGLTRIYKHNDKIFTVHFFERIMKLYMLLYTFDFTVHYLARIKLRTLLPLIIIADRGPLDNFIDMLVDTGHVVTNSLITKYFMNLQRQGLTILTKADLKTITRRRPESLANPKSRMHYQLHELLFSKYIHLYYLVNINTQKSKDINYRKILKIAYIIRRNYGHIGYGKKVRNPYAKAFLASKWFILINWLFQGAFIADTIENMIRTIIDVILPLLVFLFTNNLLISIITFILAHTVNYIINSNSPIIMLYLNKEVNVNACINKLRQYVKSQKVSNSIESIIIFGSLARDKPTKYSDIDLRVIRRHGLINAIKAFIWTAKLRVFALRHGIPIDIFICTKEKILKTIKEDELREIIILYKK